MLNELLMMQAARKQQSYDRLLSCLETCTVTILGFMGIIFFLVSLISCF